MDILRFIAVVLAAVAVVGFYIELRIRRQLMREELNFKRESQNQDIEARKLELEDRQSEREAHEHWLQTQIASIDELAATLAQSVSDHLKAEPKWASEAMERASVAASGSSIFSHRLGHFRDEKELLARRFSRILLGRARRLIDGGHEVYIVVDSGTSIFPFFAEVARATQAARQNEEDWISKLTVVTNNLPGVGVLMQHGRVSQERYSEIAVGCYLLPGAPLPMYSAVTGRYTNHALRVHRRLAGDNAVFLGLVTGNWIRLRRSEPPCPVPLARGRGHLDFKQVLVERCDEVYVVAPLGKIFCTKEDSLQNVNTALGFSEEMSDPERKPYYEVKISDEKARSVKLVTTSRKQERVLGQLSTRVEERLNTQPLTSDRYEGHYRQYLNDDVTALPHTIIPFDELPDLRFREIEIEFPHSRTRSQEIMSEYFHVIS